MEKRERHPRLLSSSYPIVLPHLYFKDNDVYFGRKKLKRNCANAKELAQIYNGNSPYEEILKNNPNIDNHLEFQAQFIDYILWWDKSINYRIKKSSKKNKKVLLISPCHSDVFHSMGGFIINNRKKYDWANVICFSNSHPFHNNSAFPGNLEKSAIEADETVIVSKMLGVNSYFLNFQNSSSNDNGSDNDISHNIDIDSLKIILYKYIIEIQPEHIFAPVSGITVIDGDLIITNTLLVNLNGLESLNAVLGNVVIVNNGNLQSFSGLNNLYKIDKNLIIAKNNLIASTEGMNSCSQINGIVLFDNNTNLKNVGIPAVKNKGDVYYKTGRGDYGSIISPKSPDRFYNSVYRFGAEPETISFSTQMHMGFDKVEGFTAERIPVIHGLPWPVNSDGKFLIPYKFVSEFTDAEKANIQAAMNEWAVRTGKVEFAHTSSGDPGHGDTRFLKIYRIPLGDAPASASIGYRPYPAMLLSDKYINSDDEIEEVDWTSEFRFGGLLHELGHVIGISHEHQRSDSDNYLDFLEGRDNNNHNCTKYGDKTDAFAVGI